MKRAQTAILVVALALVLSLTGISAQEQTPTPPPQPASSVLTTAAAPATLDASENYQIQSEDVLRISVIGEPELTTEQAVDPKGYVNIPLMGVLHVQGLTRQELIDQISLSLSKYLVEPKIQVSLTQFRRPKVYVLGMVYRPGVVEFRQGDTVMEAIAQSGSFQQEAFLEGATLTHKGSDNQIALNLYKLFIQNDLSQNLALQDGDTIYVPENVTNKFFVLGEVMRPGKFTLKDKMSIIDAISAASGVTPRANQNTAYIIRGDPKKPERIKVDIGKFLKTADMSQNVLLMAGDVVYIPETNKPDWSKISGVLSAIVNTSYLARIWGF